MAPQTSTFKPPKTSSSSSSTPTTAAAPAAPKKSTRKTILPTPSSSTAAPSPTACQSASKCQLCQIPESSATPITKPSFTTPEINSFCKLMKLPTMDYAEFFMDLDYCGHCTRMICQIHVYVQMLKEDKSYVRKLLIDNWGNVIPSSILIENDDGDAVRGGIGAQTETNGTPAPNVLASGKATPKTSKGKSATASAKRAKLVPKKLDFASPSPTPSPTSTSNASPGEGNGTGNMPNLSALAQLEKEIESLIGKCRDALLRKKNLLARKISQTDENAILSNKIIRTLAQEMPDNLEELSVLAQMDQQQAEAYGEQFLSLCAKYAALKYATILDAEEKAGQKLMSPILPFCGEPESTSTSTPTTSQVSSSSASQVTVKPKRKRARRTKKSVPVGIGENGTSDDTKTKVSMKPASESAKTPKPPSKKKARIEIEDIKENINPTNFVQIEIEEKATKLHSVDPDSKSLKEFDGTGLDTEIKFLTELDSVEPLSPGELSFQKFLDADSDVEIDTTDGIELKEANVDPDLSGGDAKMEKTEKEEAADDTEAGTNMEHVQEEKADNDAGAGIKLEEQKAAIIDEIAAEEEEYFTPETEVGLGESQGSGSSSKSSGSPGKLVIDEDRCRKFRF